MNLDFSHLYPLHVTHFHRKVLSRMNLYSCLLYPSYVTHVYEQFFSWNKSKLMSLVPAMSIMFKEGFCHAMNQDPTLLFLTYVHELESFGHGMTGVYCTSFMFMEGFCHGMHLDSSLLYLSHVMHVHGRVSSRNASRSLSTVPFSCRSCSWMRNWPVLEQMAVLSALTSSPSPYRSALIWEVWVDPRCLFSHCWVVSAGLKKVVQNKF